MQHEYSIIGHNRSEIGRWIGILSVVLAPIITSFIIWASQALLLTASIQVQLPVFALSTGLIYLVLYWLFNRYGWRWLDRILHIPDLNGRWQVNGITLNQDGTAQFNWNGELVISQKWDHIAIELKTSRSRSHSETASLLVKHDNETKLSYSYQNHPCSRETELKKHQGFCEVIFNESLEKAEGHYFNTLGRYTFGQIALTKIS